MQANFTLNQLVNEVKRLAQENPDFIYLKPIGASRPIAGNCYYTKSKNDPCKGCIFGQAILNLQPDLKPFLDEVDTRVQSNGIGRVLTDLGLANEYAWVNWCWNVQTNQDQNKSWKQSVDQA